MSGRYSRNKGRRSEYELRDILRNLGYEVDRVPLSGASQGFKGDLRVRRDGYEEFVECKVRATGFQKLYHNGLRGCWTDSAPLQFKVTPSFEDVFDPRCNNQVFVPVHQAYQPGSPLDKGLARIAKLEELAVDCPILAIKADRHPWLFIRYYRAK